MTRIVPDIASSAEQQTPKRRVTEWFRGNGWKPFRYQRQAWNAYLAGESGLIHASTGTGKTYAAWIGPLLEWLGAQRRRRQRSESPPRRGSSKRGPALRVLWITPLRALASDTQRALQKALDELAIPWVLETRTGDTPASVRRRQSRRLPTTLITTPESLSILLSRSAMREQFEQLRLVVVDEWHELLGTKRGVQTELALARLRAWRPGLRTWGLSATLGNLGLKQANADWAC